MWSPAAATHLERAGGEAERADRCVREGRQKVDVADWLAAMSDSYNCLNKLLMGEVEPSFSIAEFYFNRYLYAKIHANGKGKTSVRLLSPGKNKESESHVMKAALWSKGHSDCLPASARSSFA